MNNTNSLLAQLYETDADTRQITDAYKNSVRSKLILPNLGAVKILNISDSGVICSSLPNIAQVNKMCINVKIQGYNAQETGPAFQSWLISMFVDSVERPAKDGLGDFIHYITGEGEIKTSLNPSGKFSIQQVRIDRPIPWYLLFLHSTNYVFLGFVPHDVMKRHAKTASHGITSQSQGRKDPEYGMRPAILTKGNLNGVLSDLERYNYYGGGSHLVR